MKKLGFVFLLCFASVNAEAYPTEPVQVNEGDGIAANYGVGIVTATTLMFKSGGEAGGYPNTVKVEAGTKVYVLDSIKDEFSRNYTGVVIPSGSRDDCKIPVNNPVRSPYTGPCPSGWIQSQHVMYLFP